MSAIAIAWQGGIIVRQNLAIYVSTPVVPVLPIFHQGGSSQTTGGP